jgi:argininosuccinate lyase
LQISRGVIETAQFNAEAMRLAAAGGFSTATDVADYLVRRGATFREAHEIVGQVVRYCEAAGKELQDLALVEWQGIDGRFGEHVLYHVTVEDSVGARQSYGGTAPQRVAEQLKHAHELWDRMGANSKDTP